MRNLSIMPKKANETSVLQICWGCISSVQHWSLPNPRRSIERQISVVAHFPLSRNSHFIHNLMFPFSQHTLVQHTAMGTYIHTLKGPVRMISNELARHQHLTPLHSSQQNSMLCAVGSDIQTVKPHKGAGRCPAGG